MDITVSITFCWGWCDKNSLTNASPSRILTSHTSHSPGFLYLAAVNKPSPLHSFSFLSPCIRHSCSATAPEVGWDSVFPVRLTGTVREACLLFPSDTYLPPWLSGRNMGRCSTCASLAQIAEREERVCVLAISSV